MNLAIFDIDGTLITGRGTERRFFAFLLRSGNLGPLQILSFLAFLAFRAGRYGRHVCKKNKAYLTGLREDRVRELAVTWVDSIPESSWFEPCLERLHKHRQRGDKIVLVSGTPDFIAQAIAAKLGVEHVVGSQCVVKQGRYRCRSPVIHPFAESKARIAQQLCREHGFKPGQVVAYADSCHDLPLLSFAGKAIVVMPDDRLAQQALARDWEILGQRKQRTWCIAKLFAGSSAFLSQK